MRTKIFTTLAIMGLSVTALPCAGPCILPCGSSTQFSACHNADGTTTVTLWHGEQNASVEVPNGSTQSVGAFGVIIHPTGTGTWGNVSECSGISGICESQQ